MPELPFPERGGAFDTLLASAIRRLLNGEALKPFCDWFAPELASLMMEEDSAAPQDEADGRRYRWTIARTLWGALPVPANRWRPRSLPKVERNDPCHCGSGRKFKQCCAEFVGIAPPMTADGLYVIALTMADPEMLAPEQIRLVPGETLGMAAVEWNDQGQPERTTGVLAPLFQQRVDLDGRHALAFDALLDALQAQGKATQRLELAQHVSQSRDKTLATSARCRQAAMLADQGDFDAAWGMFQSAQRLNPSDVQLLHLELTLLLAQGRHEEAKLRAPLLAAKASKAGQDDLAELLLKLAEGGFAGAYEHANAGDVDDLEDLAWIALCEQTPAEIAPENCRALYRIRQLPSPDAGQPPVLSVQPVKKLADLQRRWHRRFPVGKPMLTALQGDADGLLAELAEAAQFLQENPQAWLSMEVLDDLLLAAAELCDWETPVPVMRAAHRLAQHALAVLQALAGKAADAVPAQLHWADMDSRPLLRLLAQAIDQARLMDDLKEEERLARWGLALNPNDNHGWRSVLVPLYFARGEFAEALALLERYPDDLPPAEHNRALALFAMGRRDEAEAVLRLAHEAYPGMLAALLPETLDLPEEESGPGLLLGGAMAAFHNRGETRAAWVATGALAWAKALNLPEPAPRKAPRPMTAKALGASGKHKNDNGGKSASLIAAALEQFGSKQETHLRKTYPDYPRLHGLLMAIAWSPELIMPNKWLEMVMALRAEPVSGLPESKALKIMNADLAALTGLLNSLTAQMLETPLHQGPPMREVLALAAAENALFAWAAGFVQGSELVSSGWRRAGRPVSIGKGVFGELYALAARAQGAPDAWRARLDAGQPLLVGLDDSPPQPLDTLTLALADLWRVIAPLRQARAGTATV